MEARTTRRGHVDIQQRRISRQVHITTRRGHVDIQQRRISEQVHITSRGEVMLISNRGVYRDKFTLLPGEGCGGGDVVFERYVSLGR